MLSMDLPCGERSRRREPHFRGVREDISIRCRHRQRWARVCRVLCGTRQCASSGRFTHQPCLLRRLLHLGVQHRFEVLDVEHHAVSPADREVEVLPAVGVGCEPAHGSGPLLELHLVAWVVAIVRARRLRNHPEGGQHYDDVRRGEETWQRHNHK